jgi:hypothetical protein
VKVAVTTGSMTDEQRKSVALEYLKAFDNGGVTSNGGSILDLFACEGTSSGEHMDGPYPGLSAGGGDPSQRLG